MKPAARLILRLAVAGLFTAATIDVPVPAAMPRARVYAIDASGSTGAASVRDARRAFEHDGRRVDRASFLAFGAKPVPFRDTVPDVERDRTDLGAAIEAALALAGDDADVVLATDGRDTEGGLDRAVLLAQARGIPLHVLPIGPVDAVDVRIADVDVPVAAPGGRFDARVTIESTGPAKGSLNGTAFEFAGAGRQTIVLRDLPAAPRLALRLDVADTCPENDAAEVTVLVRESAPRVLAPPHVAALLPREWTVESAGRPEEFDAVIVDRLSPDAARACAQHGVGLIVLGGSRSYAPGGFHGTPLEEAMPLWAFPEERATVVFLLDASGSMSQAHLGRPRIEVALDAVAAALDLVHSDDHWALVSFSSDARTLVPLGRGRGRLPKISPAGPTHLVPAVKHALDLAETATSGKKHVVLITDGETQEADAELAAVGRRAAERGARLTVVATGAGPKLAALGATVVPSHNLSKLADALKAALARSRDLFVENAKPEPRANPLVAGLPAWPVLPRINRTTAKRTADVIVASGDHPVLALGRHGHGAVAAATFAIEEGWAVAWDGWPALLRRLVEHVSPPAPGIAGASARLERGEVVFSVRRAGGADAIDALPVRLLRRGADLYEGRVPARAGTTVLRIGGRAVAAFTLAHAPEYAALGPDAASIARITGRTGGRVVAGTNDLGALPPRRAAGTAPGRPFFLIAALAGFLLDLALGIFWK